MDAFTEQHLATWLDSYAREDEREEIERKIRAMVTEYPEMLLTHSWPEILYLVERNEMCGIGAR